MGRGRLCQCSSRMLFRLRCGYTLERADGISSPSHKTSAKRSDRSYEGCAEGEDRFRSLSPLAPRGGKLQCFPTEHLQHSCCRSKQRCGKRNRLAKGILCQCFLSYTFEDNVSARLSPFRRHNRADRR